MRRATCVTVVAVMLAIFAGTSAFGRDLVLRDVKMGFYDRNNNTAWTQPCTDCWSSYLGQRDSAGWMIYDTLVRVLMVYELEDHSQTNVHDIEWVEWAYKLHLRSQMDFQESETVWISIGAKINQASAAPGPEEARRWWTADYWDDYWPFVTHVQNVRFNTDDFVLYNRPYYSNPYFPLFMSFVPDSNLEIGYNPSHFRYWVVHLSAVPYFHDTLRVSAGWFPDCSRIHWTASDTSDQNNPDLPVYPVISSLPQDPTRPGVYLVDEAELGLPPGTYDVRARVAASIGRPSYSFDVDADVNLDGSSRDIYELRLSSEQLGQCPQVAEFWQDSTLVLRRPLGTLDVQWPDTLGHIVPISPWEN